MPAYAYSIEQYKINSRSPEGSWPLMNGTCPIGDSVKVLVMGNGNGNQSLIKGNRGKNCSVL